VPLLDDARGGFDWGLLMAIVGRRLPSVPVGPAFDVESSDSCHSSVAESELGFPKVAGGSSAC